ncbi:hypothetical protein ElyMa_003899700 [Elysia marginata]|uniref:DUF19 domain-containing protein n=1 Tax=Elysia marginata TaxID=1093978 RepID=A0AAV4FNM7_9GAST|nr:hypothetical protein ElyMa_003899700 [Elysia marginata]
MWLSALGLMNVSGTGACPADLAEEARGCFSSYTVKLHSMQHTAQKLCCGLDVEILRAFCKSYEVGRRCVQSLRAQCPPEKQRVIDSALVSLDGAWDALNDLCLDDRIVEQYAQFQTCFTVTGPESESCFAEHLLGNAGGHNSIQFLETVGAASKRQFCRKMVKTVSCVQQNVRRQCGEGAAALVSILVKPMVKRSTECDYTLDVRQSQQSPKEPYQSNPSYISDDGSSRNNNKHGGSSRRGTNSNNKNLAASLRPSLTSLALFLLSVVMLLYLTNCPIPSS